MEQAIQRNKRTVAAVTNDKNISDEDNKLKLQCLQSDLETDILIAGIDEIKKFTLLNDMRSALSEFEAQIKCCSDFCSRPRVLELVNTHYTVAPKRVQNSSFMLKALACASIALGIALLISGILTLGPGAYVVGGVLTAVGLFGLYKNNTPSNEVSYQEDIQLN